MRMTTITRAAALAALTLAGLLAGCSSQKAPDGRRAQGQSPATAPAIAPPSAPASATAAAPAARQSSYTSFKSCREVEFDEDEGGSSVMACPGVGGYRLRILAGDLRETITVEPPGGPARDLNLVGTTGSGGFSRLGDTAEWRGSGASEAGGPAFRPDALIVRYFVVEDSLRPDKETAYLVVASLRNGKPCVTATVPPGPNQNEHARALADAPGRCKA